MKKLPASIKPDLPTYFLAKRMENAGMLRPGHALMLAATVGLKSTEKVIAQPRPHFNPLPRSRSQGGGGQSGVAVVTTQLDPFNISPKVVLSSGNLVVTAIATQSNGNLSRSLAGHSSGKFYAEGMIAVSSGNGSDGFGIISAAQDITANNFLGGSGNLSIGYYNDGRVYMNAVGIATIEMPGVNDVFGVALDIGHAKVWFRKNGGNWDNNAAHDPVANVGGFDISIFLPATVYFGVDTEGINAQSVVNFGAEPFRFAPPAGFTLW